MSKWPLRVLAAASALLFVVLAVLSKTALEPQGMLIFDSRFTGYGPEQARAYLAALAEVPGARELYLGAFHTLDTIFLTMLALTLSGAIWVCMPTRRSLKYWLLLLAPLAYLAMDLAENAKVAEMLRTPGPLSDAIVMQASGFTLAKWVTLALSAVIVLWMWRADVNRRVP